MHTPNIETHSGLKTRPGNQWYSRSMLQILACWALFWKANQERWQCIAYNIISVQIRWHYLPWEGKKIYFRNMLWLWEITIHSDWYHREVKFVERWHTSPGCFTFICTQPQSSAFIPSAPSHPLIRWRGRLCFTRSALHQLTLSCMAHNCQNFCTSGIVTNIWVFFTPFKSQNI